MLERWLWIEKESVEKTKQFAKLLYDANLPGNWQWFDKSASGARSRPRQPDSEMTLETYLDNVTEEIIVRFVLGREEYNPNFEKISAISLVMRSFFPGSSGSKFSWYFCPYSNYEQVNELFKKVYGSDIVDYEQQEILET